MKILITGAAGFIGSLLSKKLADLGHEILGLDNFNNYYSTNLKYERTKRITSPGGVKVDKLDLTDRRKLLNKMEHFSPETVIHLSGQAGVRLPIEEIHKYTDSNLLGFCNIMQSVVQLGIPNFLYASSSSVYGGSKNTPLSEKNLDLRPISFYGATKLSNEILCSSIIPDSQTRARGLRFFTVYGPWGRPDMAYFKIAMAAEGISKFTLNGDGEILRDFTFVDDVLNAIVKLTDQLKNQERGYNDVVNIGGGAPHTINKLISVFEEIYSSKIPVVLGNPVLNDSKKTEADWNYLISIIGEKPKTSIEEGILNFVRWVKDMKKENKLETWAIP
jgi:UDP-glucuronate 4-epimerase